MMTSAQVVETSVNVTSNSPSQDYTHPDDHNLPNYNLDLFSRFSGLKLNEEKTEFFCSGVQNLSKSFSYEFKHSIKILGVHFDYDELSRKKANFEAIIKSIKKH